MSPRFNGLDQRQIIGPPPDIFSDLTSDIGDITSNIEGGLSSVFDPFPATSIDSVTTTSTASATDSLSTDLSSILPSSSVESIPSSTDGPSSTSTLTPVPSSTITPIAQSTVTNVLTQTAVSPSQSSAATPNGFLANKALSGFVFALVGLFALIIIFSIATFAMRRHQRKRLVQEAVSFEPAESRMYLDEMDREDNLRNEKSGGDFGGYAVGHLQYQPPVPPPRVLYTPPSQLAYTNPVEAHDSFSSNDHSRTLSEGSSIQHSSFRMAAPRFEGNVTAPPPSLRFANT